MYYLPFKVKKEVRVKNRFCVSSSLIISICTIVLLFLSLIPLYANDQIDDAPANTQEPATTSSNTEETTTLSATVSEPTEPPTISNEMKIMDVNIGISSNTGAANASIPIEVPPGRNGVAPNLALSYNSNMGNGWIGGGWSLGLGEIQRSTKRGVKYFTNDFVFVMNGASSELADRGW